MQFQPFFPGVILSFCIVSGSTLFLNAGDDIPFRLHKSYMILISGSIGPLDNLTFLIDTGASSTLISPHVARKLKIKGVSKDAAAYGSELKCPLVVLHDIQLGSREFDFVPTLVADFSGLGPIGNRIDAIVGMNLLKRTRCLRIDYVTKTLSFAPQDDLPHSVTLNCPDLIPFITLELHGVPVRLLLDTGARDILLFRDQVKDIPRAATRPFRKTINHLGSAEKVQGVVFDEVGLGSVDWDRIGVFLLESRLEQYDALEGIAGVSALNLSSFQLDFQNQLFSWAR